MPTAARMVLTLIVPGSLCCLLEAGIASTSVPLVGAEVVAAAAGRASRRPPPPSTFRAIRTSPSPTHVRPATTAYRRQLPPASFAHATKQGDLLVAAVLCGVLQAGMSVPKLTTAPGWDKGKKRTGGIQGGLEAAMYYRVDNPGGISSVPLGYVPAGSDDVSCTTFTWEITGAGDISSLDAYRVQQCRRRNVDLRCHLQGHATRSRSRSGRRDGRQRVPAQSVLGCRIISTWSRSGQTGRPTNRAPSLRW